jgi:hypothetical protein
MSISPVLFSNDSTAAAAAQTLSLWPHMTGMNRFKTCLSLRAELSSFCMYGFFPDSAQEASVHVSIAGF